MTLETEILLNQIAQGVRPMQEGIALVSRGASAHDAWISLRMMVCQARPRLHDVEEAIASAGLKPTYTPCVLLLKDQRPNQIEKVAALPANEAEKAFRLLVTVFAVADRRRRESCPANCQHGWHRDFSDPNVLAEIRQRGYV